MPTDAAVNWFAFAPELTRIAEIGCCQAPKRTAHHLPGDRAWSVALARIRTGQMTVPLCWNHDTIGQRRALRSNVLCLNCEPPPAARSERRAGCVVIPT